MASENTIMALTRTSRPGGRTAQVRAAVLAAVQAELAEHGYDALSIDSVAQRSGVHRATVYRRWRDVGGLLADILNAARVEGWEPPDTGSLAGDLVALNREFLAAFTAQPSISAALVAASFRSPDAAQALRAFWADRYDRCAIVVTRAAQRGEARPDTDHRRLLMAATSPLYHHLVLLREPLPTQLADQYAHDAADAARAGVYRATRSRTLFLKSEAKCQG